MGKRILEIFRDGKAGKKIALQVPLLDGEQGNFQTLRVMKEIVVRDRLKSDLRRLVLKNIVGETPGHDADGEIKKVFEFAQKQICYRRDPVEVERVCDLWTTLFGQENDKEYSPEGDCGVKAVFLATCLALLGYRPVFVIIKQDPRPDANFNHIYNGYLSDDGKVNYLDATPEDKPAGYEPRAYQKFIVPIFE